MLTYKRPMARTPPSAFLASAFALLTLSALVTAEAHAGPFDGLGQSLGQSLSRTISKEMDTAVNAITAPARHTGSPNDTEQEMATNADSAKPKTTRAQARLAAAHPPNIDQCNEQAAGKSGDERKAFMKQCTGQQ